MPAYTETYLAVCLETAGWRGEAEHGWSQGIGGREDDAPVVDAVFVGRGGGAGEREVPFEEVGFERVCGEGGVGVQGHFARFGEDALDGGGFGVEAGAGRHGGGSAGGSCGADGELGRD